MEMSENTSLQGNIAISIDSYKINSSHCKFPKIQVVFLLVGSDTELGAVYLHPLLEYDYFQFDMNIFQSFQTRLSMPNLSHCVVFVFGVCIDYIQCDGDVPLLLQKEDACR